jgi:hypothetical protein
MSQEKLMFIEELTKFLTYFPQPKQYTPQEISFP